MKIFVSATNVFTGKIRVFSEKEVTLDAVMASACLPQVFQAVEIEGEPIGMAATWAIRRSIRCSTTPTRRM